MGKAPTVLAFFVIFSLLKTIFMFIVFEGIDGSGKTEILNQLKLIYKKAVFTREPGGTLFAEEIRNLIFKNSVDSLTAALALQSARLDHLEKVINPALQQGNFVFSDRYYPSMMAYQDFIKNPLIHDLIRITSTLVPDLVFYLDCSVDVAMKRCKIQDSFDCKSRDFFKEVQKRYQILFEYEKNWIRIDTEKNSVEDTLKEILNTINSIGG